MALISPRQVQIHYYGVSIHGVFLFLTGLCGTIYCDQICDDEEESHLLASVAYLYRLPIEMLKGAHDCFRIDPRAYPTAMNGQQEDYWNGWNKKATTREMHRITPTGRQS